MNPNAASFVPASVIAAVEQMLEQPVPAAAVPEEHDDSHSDCGSFVTDLGDDEDFRFPIPVAPTPVPAAAATRAFIRFWNDGKELTMSLDYVNGLEMEELEYSIRGLTAQFLSPKPAPGVRAPKPKKKFYDVNICASCSVRGIDDYFKKRFGNPDKKWELRMGRSLMGTQWNRKWGKVECSFILC